MFWPPILGDPGVGKCGGDLYSWPMPDTSLFQFEQVTVAGPSGVRLESVSLVIPAEGITTIVGPSGSGKTTLLRLCNRLELPTSGRILYRGSPIAELDPLQLRRHVGMVFQKPVLFPGTIRDNLAEANGILSTADCHAILDRVALDRGLLNRNADELSGGEAQRACLARALVASPSAILMDEPTSSLDGAASRRLEELARSLVEDGIPVVWVSHDLAQMERIADRVALIIDGSIRLWGTPTELAASADARIRAFMEGVESANG